MGDPAKDNEALQNELRTLEMMGGASYAQQHGGKRTQLLDMFEAPRGMVVSSHSPLLHEVPNAPVVPLEPGGNDPQAKLAAEERRAAMRRDCGQQAEFVLMEAPTPDGGERWQTLPVLPEDVHKDPWQLQQDALGKSPAVQLLKNAAITLATRR